jgi:hypothetical protein
MLDFQSVLMQRPGEYHNVIEESYWKNNVSDISAGANLYFYVNEIRLILIGYSKSANAEVVQDYFFDEIFTGVEGNINLVQIRKIYNKNISDKNDEYVASLEKLEFDCVDLVCTKESDDIVYSWKVESNNAYIYTIEYKQQEERDIAPLYYKNSYMYQLIRG